MCSVIIWSSAICWVWWSVIVTNRGNIGYGAQRSSAWGRIEQQVLYGNYWTWGCCQWWASSSGTVLLGDAECRGGGAHLCKDASEGSGMCKLCLQAMACHSPIPHLCHFHPQVLEQQKGTHTDLITDFCSTQQPDFISSCKTPWGLDQRLQANNFFSS